jgi:hypothetical protein
MHRGRARRLPEGIPLESLLSQPIPWGSAWGPPKEMPSWGPTTVVDDLIGLRDDVEYDTYMAPIYGFWFQEEFFAALDAGIEQPEDTNDPEGAWRQWYLGLIDDGVPDLFATAARAAGQGRLHPGLFEHLASLRYHPNGVLEIPDLRAFASWCLTETLREAPPTVEDCGVCGKPWIAERGARYCARPAPGTIVPCRQLQARKRYEHAHPDFYRQRRRLYDRMKRGTLPKTDYQHWLATNRPGPIGATWVTWEDWQRGITPSHT